MIQVRLPAWWSRLGHTRGRLIGLAVVATLPIAAMAATIGWQDYQAVARGAVVSAAFLNGRAATGVEGAVDGIVAQLASIANLPLAARCSANVAAPATIIVLDAGGAVRCRLGTAPAVAVPPATWAALAGAFPGRLTLDGHPVLGMAAREGGSVAAMLSPDWPVRAALPLKLAEGDAIWLLDGKNTVLGSVGAVENALPTLRTMQALAGRAQASRRAASSRGKSYAYATSQLSGGWRLLVATSAQRSKDLATRELLVRLAELTALLVVGFAAAVLGADVAFGTPLRRLRDAVRRWQGGAPFAPGDLVGAPDEVHQLARSFAEATGELQQRQDELAQAQELQRLLLLEIHHRVKNNLQVVASLLNLQASRIRVPEAKVEFQAARDRVRALATLHRHLYADGGLHTINMRSFLTELCGQLFQAIGETEGERIRLHIDAMELRMSSDQAVPLALIVTEAVTNSVRYAFPGGRSGQVSVLLATVGSELELTISDDGVGVSIGRAEAGAGMREGLGLQLIRGFSRQLGGSLVVEEAHGTRYTVRMTLQAQQTPGLDDAALPRDNAA